MMTPDHKKKRTKLNVMEYQDLRKKASKRALGHCELCYSWCPLSNGHLHHIKSRGAGGGDDFDVDKDSPNNNVLWLCYLCHDKKHRGLI